MTRIAESIVIDGPDSRDEARAQIGILPRGARVLFVLPGAAHDTISTSGMRGLQPSEGAPQRAPIDGAATFSTWREGPAGKVAQ